MVTVDIDEPYSDWRLLELANTKQLIYNGIGGVKSAFIRKSSGGHVHIRVHLDHEVSIFESFMIRAFLCDDAARLACDLDRYYRTGRLENTGRTFDQKYTRGQLRHAGRWQRI